MKDPDWFFYVLRELLNTQRNITNQLSSLGDPSILSLSMQLLKLLENNLESIPRQVWEVTNGINLVRLLLKYFETHAGSFLSSICHLSNFDSCAESNYVKLSLLYYFVYLHGEFCRITLSFASSLPNYANLVSLINQLLKALEPISLKCNNLTPVLENQLKIMEVRNEMNGLVEEAKLGDLIRFGILMKFNSKMGLENRMFILTKNYLLYGSRVSSAVGFRLHGILPVVTLKLEPSNENELPNSFSINTGGKILLVSAFNERSKEFWIRDLDFAIRRAEPLLSSQTGNSTIGSIPSNLNEVEAKPLTTYRLNNMLHVCWHRNLSISFKQICHVTKYTISGYLLRKFKNSAGWQKLFVTFNHVCLFFYKSHEEKIPLATLPLLGYKIDTPSPDDNINKDFVFKITFKNHIYYFRTESPFTFKRWIYVLSQATNCI